MVSSGIVHMHKKNVMLTFAAAAEKSIRHGSELHCVAKMHATTVHVGRLTISVVR